MKRLRLAIVVMALCAPLNVAQATATPPAGPGSAAARYAHPTVARRVASYSVTSTPHDTVTPMTRERAGAVNDRPALSGTATVDCGFSPTMCLHYTTAGEDAVTASYVKQVEATLTHVDGVYHASGYRYPDADASSGTANNPNGKIDVYLQQLGNSDYYGYCTTTAPASPRGNRDASAYCVLDNDYADRIYKHQTPLHNLQVTVAHEYFHAVQFAYDYTEDSWFMEATATWAEDELYTNINDNRQYLPYGPLGRPSIPLDDDSGGPNVYGDWLFFRYLTERFGGRSGPLPVIVRQMWVAAARPGIYSIRAVEAALHGHGTDLRTQFADFADANRHPQTSYSEGRAYHSAAPAATYSLTRVHPRRAGSGTVHHLASVTEELRHGTVRGWHLHVTVTTTTPADSAARVSTWLRNGHVHTVRVPLNRRIGSVTVPFGAQVERAEITLVNSSARYRCDTGDVYSCEGTPIDDDLTLHWSADVS